MGNKHITFVFSIVFGAIPLMVKLIYWYIYQNEEWFFNTEEIIVLTLAVSIDTINFMHNKKNPLAIPYGIVFLVFSIVLYVTVILAKYVVFNINLILIKIIALLFFAFLMAYELYQRTSKSIEKPPVAFYVSTVGSIFISVLAVHYFFNDYQEEKERLAGLKVLQEQVLSIEDSIDEIERVLGKKRTLIKGVNLRKNNLDHSDDLIKFTKLISTSERAFLQVMLRLQRAKKGLSTPKSIDSKRFKKLQKEIDKLEFVDIKRIVTNIADGDKYLENIEKN